MADDKRSVSGGQISGQNKAGTTNLRQTASGAYHATTPTTRALQGPAPNTDRRRFVTHN